ncbi:FecR family protein [Spirosoma montaniterrae]|uniref:Iron dicitrate transport regulator FecR n=1 Tax=Spirosoma montaniterrae TaxID=1178516 RepID=A0A1P9X366_9BACT|nr:FecR domain-containing protein [Spirosoma montaniterrae]AQG82067.1 hypothetical protein AWR27_23885 [Spirosoma montaniterrae]
MTEDILQRYFANQVTPDEARRVLNWFATNEGQVYLKHRLDQQFDQAEWQTLPNAAATAPDADKLLAALRQRLTPVRPLTDETPVRQLPWYSQPMRWAAVLIGTLLLAAGGFYGYQYVYPADLIQQTAYGKTSRFTLPDGSTVTLNGNSRLRYAPRWATGTTREVWLDGEGFFRVTHQANHERFVVHLPNKLNIEVLGTQFNVLARPSRTRIVLSSGRIRLENQAGQQVEMRPGELVETSPRTKYVNRRRVNPVADASWQTDRLTFDDASLQDMVDRLEETYGLSVTVKKPELLQQRFSGTVPNHNVNVLLDGLAQLFGLSIQRHGNQVIIDSND